GGANQENVFFELPAERALFQQNRAHQIHFRFDEIRAHGLSSIEVGNESELAFGHGERRKIRFVEWLGVKITHRFFPSRILVMRSFVIGLIMSGARSKDPLSVTTFSVLRVESTITWQLEQWARWASNCRRTSSATSPSR